MHIKFIIIILFVVIFLLGGVGYFIFFKQPTAPQKFEQQYNVDQITDVSQKKEGVAVTNRTNAQTENWKIYKNTRYAYQFKYPEEEWQFGQFPSREEPPSETADEVTLTRIVTVKPDQFSSYSFYHMRFTISVHPNPNNLTLKEWYYFSQWASEKFYNKNTPYLTIGLPVNKLDEKDLDDLKMKAKTISYPPEIKEVVFQSFPALKTTSNMAGNIIFAKSSFMFSVGWHVVDNEDPKNPANQLFEKILSTFSFVN